MSRLATLFRSNSDADIIQDSRFEARSSNIPKGDLDCGIMSLGWCNSLACQRLGNSNTFLAVFVVAGLLQGAVTSYFRISAKQVALQYDFDPNLIDWLLVASGLTQGVFAILVAYWGNRIHRISWLGGILMLQACLIIMGIIPTLVKKDTGPIETAKVTDLCFEYVAGRLDSARSHAITTQIMLFIVQFGIGMGNVAFYCLGISYLDDNLKEHESPAYIAGSLAAYLWGSQFGSAIAFLVEGVKTGWWMGWTILTPLVFTSGLLIALFPRRLLKTAIQLAANRILETMSTANSSSPMRYLADIAFWPSIRRMIANKLLMFNVVGFMLLQTAIINFQAQEEKYLQSRFFLPTSEADGLSDEWTSRLITYLLTPPLVGLSCLVAGLIIAKINPSPRKLAGWNLITSSIVALLFIAYIFLKCQNGQIAGSYNGKLMQPTCSTQCLCKNNQFYPVCPKDSSRTYFSPCHAGCSQESNINGIKVFTNCSCGADMQIRLDFNKPDFDGIATDGACNNGGCQKFWITFQALNAIGAALLASSLIGNLLITIRSVLPQDKSLALAFQLSAVGLFAYIPGKVSYDAVARSTCALWSISGSVKVCRLQNNPSYGNIINILTASLILLATLFEALVYYYVDYLPIYGEDDYYNNDSSTEMHLVNPSQPPAQLSTQPTVIQSNEQQEPSSTTPLITQQPSPKASPAPPEPTSPVPSSLLTGSLNSNQSEMMRNLPNRASIQPKKPYEQNLADILRTAPIMKAQRDERLSRTLPPQTSDEIEELNFEPQIPQRASPVKIQEVSEPKKSFSERFQTEPLQRPPNLELEDSNINKSQSNLAPLTPVTHMRYDLTNQRPLSPETDF